MKKSLLIFGLMGLIACDQATKEPVTPEEGEDVIKEVTYYPSGMVQVMSQLKDGQLNGVHLEIDSRGNLIHQNTYLNGKLDGTQMNYGTSGRIELKVNYKNGVLDGEYAKYNKDGKSFQETCTYVDGVKHGKASWYYSNGKLSMTYNYEHGKINGLAQQFYESGNQKAEANFVNDEIQGEWKKYEDNKAK